MLNITLISGKPGSGKTYTARLMSLTCHPDRVLHTTYHASPKIFNFIKKNASFYFDMIILDECVNETKLLNKIENLIVNYNVEIDIEEKSFTKPNLHLVIISQQKLDKLNPWIMTSNNLYVNSINELVLPFIYKFSN